MRSITNQERDTDGTLQSLIWDRKVKDWRTHNVSLSEPYHRFLTWFIYFVKTENVKRKATYSTVDKSGGYQDTPEYHVADPVAYMNAWLNRSYRSLGPRVSTLWKKTEIETDRPACHCPVRTLCGFLLDASDTVVICWRCNIKYLRRAKINSLETRMYSVFEKH
jgi:hypothetical protein